MYDNFKKEIDQQFNQENNYVIIKQKINKSHHYLRYTSIALITLILFIFINNSLNNHKNNKEVLNELSDQVISNNENKKQDEEAAINENEMIEDIDDIQYPSFYGGMYIDDNGNNVILLCIDSKDNRKQICELLGITESKTVFKTCEYSYQYLTSLQDKISNNMINKTMSYISSSSLREDLNCIEVTVNTKDETKLNQIYNLDSQGGAISIKYSYDNDDVQKE